MTILDVIARKRDGHRHTSEEITFLAQSAAGQHHVAEYQLSAWLMAAFLNGLDDEETLWLTKAMAATGVRLDLSALPRPWLDKHSTGGVGDKTTLVVLPILAACGLTVVKMSGRGLGITGGTVDKLESIPGFSTDLTPAELLDQAGHIGIAISGQSPNLAPADKSLYALRDTTGTVGAMPLIVASILSKKIAAGAEHLVLDVKCGSGAFMPDVESARELGHLLKRTAEACGLRTAVAITDMGQPLGRCVGNALEIREAMQVLEGAKGRFTDLCIELASGALQLAGMDPSAVARVLASRAAWDKWDQLVRAQTKGVFGAQNLYERLPGADDIEDVVWNGPSGWVSHIDAGRIGQAVVDLGGGRLEKDDPIDHAVGLEILLEIGSPIATGDVWARVHSNRGKHVSVEDAIQVTGSQILSMDALIEWLS